MYIRLQIFSGIEDLIGYILNKLSHHTIRLHAQKRAAHRRKRNERRKMRSKMLEEGKGL